MTARRRRVTSESDPPYVPLVIDTGGAFNNNSTLPRNAFNVITSKSVSNIKNTSSSIARIMSRDRTSEFANAIQSLQCRNIVRAVNTSDVKKVKSLQHYGEFMMLAKFIGGNIAQTYSKLEKLTLLAKQKSLFNDRPTEIQELSYIIKEDLKSLNDQLSRLQNISKDQNVGHKNGKNHLISHSNSVVSTLQSKVVSMSNEFKHVLDMRTENLKQAKSRRDQFSKRESSRTPSSYQNGSLLFTHSDEFDRSTPGCANSQQQQLLIQDETEQYLENRADTMQNIESTIVELGGIFQQLAHMVKEQDEMVQRIDANVYDVEMNVEAAHHQILRYFQSVTSNRWLMIKIFLVLMFFFTFFVVFLT